MTNLDAKNLNRYLLEIECLVTAGPIASSIRESLHEGISGLQPKRRRSEGVRQEFNSLLQNQYVLSRCSFAMLVSEGADNFQSFTNGPHAVEALARVERARETDDPDEHQVDLTLLLGTTYNGVGGLSRKKPSQMPVIVGDWYFITAHGGPQAYIHHATRLRAPENMPSEAEILGRVQQRQTDARQHSYMWGDQLKP